MGVVNRARRPGGQRVALKVLRRHVVGDAEARERLAREVKSLSRVRSPRIAEIVDADPWGPVPFVATRYVPGLNLHDHVAEEGRLEGSDRSEEHTSELQSLMRISYAVFCLKKKKIPYITSTPHRSTH